MRYFLIIGILLAATLSAFAVPFTLQNNSATSVPLIISHYMNPNLSPFSKSAVDIPVGEKIYFKHKGKKYLLLEVTSDLEGKTLVINKLIKEKTKELSH